MKPFQKSLATFIGLVMITSFHAMAADLSAPMSLKRMADETAALNEAKNLVLQRYQNEVKSCWQLFAVNDCLFKARQQKYQSLNPLDQREIDLNIRQRALKELERQQRLSDKSIEAPKDKAVP